MDKEELILKTAMEVFVEKGWHGTKMQEIADRAGINKALLHYYYRSKEKLYTKIFEYLVWKNIGEAIRIFNTEMNLPFEKYLKNFISAYIDMLNKNPRIPFFLLRELTDGAKRIKPILEELIRKGKFDIKPVLSRIREASEKGEIRPIDPPQLMTTVVGSCLFFFIAEPMVMTLMVDENFNREQFIEDRKEAVYQIIMNGISVKGVS